MQTRCTRPSSRPCLLTEARLLAREGSFAGCIAIAGDLAIGTHVDTYWPLDQMWMNAGIDSFAPDTGRHGVSFALTGKRRRHTPCGRSAFVSQRGAPNEGPQGAAKPGGNGWYPGAEARAAAAAAEEETLAGATRMAAGKRLVDKAVVAVVQHEDMIKDYPGSPDDACGE